jgi:hypothetical protein
MSVVPSRRLVIIAVSVVLGVAAVRCTDNQSSVAPRRVGARVSNAKITDEARARARAARTKGAWMGEFHSNAIHDWIEGRKELGKNATLEAKCALVWRLARKYAPKAAEHGALTKEVVDELEAYGAKKGCGGPSGLDAYISSAAANSRQLSIFGVLKAQWEGATGVYADYEPQLEAAYNNPSTPDDVAAVSWAVIDQAAANGIPQADLEVLAGLASISVSSAYDWYAYELSGGFSGGGGGAGDVPMYSVFGALSLCGKWCKVGWADLGGALWGALVSGGNPGVALLRGTVVSLITAAVI